MPYQGLSTFLKAPVNDQTKPFRFLGIPYDCSVSFRPGARMGPNAVRSSSMMLTDGDHPVFEIDPSNYVSDYGDIAVTSVAPEKALAEIEAGIDQHSGNHLIIAGGDHLTTLGVLRSLFKQHGQMALIHCDAHCDTWEMGFGERYGHGTFLRNAIEEGLIDPTSTISIGPRSPVDPATKRWLGEQGGTTITTREALKQGPVRLADGCHRVLGDIPVYLTVDCDFCDPSICPGTGTPEIGGPSSAFLIEFIEGLSGLNLIGMDVVEVAPAYDVANITSLVAATVLWTYASMMIGNKHG